MSAIIRQAIRPALRSVSSKRIAVTALRYNSTAAEPAKAPVDAKITTIVDNFNFDSLETSQLINELKERLNISDISLPVGGAQAAPVAQAAPAEEEVKEEVEEKTIFSIKLESFDAKSKPKIIKEVKGMLGLSLVESKKFVESAPKVLKEKCCQRRC